jgi:hypothetical protein
MELQNHYARKAVAILGFGCANTSWGYSETDEMTSLAVGIPRYARLTSSSRRGKHFPAFVEVPLRRICLAALAALVLSLMAPAATKPVVLFIEGDSSVIPKFVNLCRQMGPEYGLDFRFVDKREDPYEYRVILSAEGSGTWNFAQGNIVVLNPEAKVIFTVIRSNRWTAKGATSALTKEFVKVMARYLGAHR